VIYVILTDSYRNLPVQGVLKFLFGLIGIMDQEVCSGESPFTKQYFVLDCLMESYICSCQQLVSWHRWKAIHMRRPPQVVTCRRLGRWRRACRLSRTVLSNRPLQTFSRWICG